MTRETALYKLCEREDNPLNIINEVFNDFQSRICENCSKWKQENSTQTVNNKGMCNSYRDGDEYYTIGITSGTHGCNEFERKEDDK